MARRQLGWSPQRHRAGTWPGRSPQAHAGPGGRGVAAGGADRPTALGGGGRDTGFAARRRMTCCGALSGRIPRRLTRGALAPRAARGPSRRAAPRSAGSGRDGRPWRRGAAWVLVRWPEGAILDWLFKAAWCSPAGTQHFGATRVAAGRAWGMGHFRAAHALKVTAVWQHSCGASGPHPLPFLPGV